MQDELGTETGMPWGTDTPAGAFRKMLKADPCAYCGRRRGGTIDHIVPRGSGGISAPSLNGTGSCFRCNNMKSDTPLLEFLLNTNNRRELFLDD
jgi:HNH endonuclease